MKPELSLKHFFLRHDPSRVGEVGSLLSSYGESLGELWAQLFKQYDLEDGELEIEERLHEIYRQHDTSKISNIPEIVRTSRGKFDSMFDSIQKKYNIGEHELLRHDADANVTVGITEAGIAKLGDNALVHDMSEASDLHLNSIDHSANATKESHATHVDLMMEREESAVNVEGVKSWTAKVGDHEIGDEEEEEADPRVNYKAPPEFIIKKSVIGFFILVKIILPLLDFYTDLTMMATFGIPAIIGYEVCVVPRDGQTSTEFQYAPKWTLDGEECGYVDTRVSGDAPPAATGGTRRRLNMDEIATKRNEKATAKAKIHARAEKYRKWGPLGFFIPNTDLLSKLNPFDPNWQTNIYGKTLGGLSDVERRDEEELSEKKADWLQSNGNSASTDGFESDSDEEAEDENSVSALLKRDDVTELEKSRLRTYGRRYLAQDDIITPSTDITDNCKQYTTQANCIATGSNERRKCRWGDEITGTDECYDPVLETFLLEDAQGATIERGVFERLYCAEFQPFHRGGGGNSSTASVDVCREYEDSDGNLACDYDFAYGYCAVKESFRWYKRPDDCRDVQSHADWNQANNITCLAMCHCDYRPEYAPGDPATVSRATGTMWHCIDRRMQDYIRNPTGVTYQDESDSVDFYCSVMQTQSCCTGATYEGFANVCTWSSGSCGGATRRRLSGVRAGVTLDGGADEGVFTDLDLTPLPPNSDATEETPSNMVASLRGGLRESAQQMVFGIPQMVPTLAPFPADSSDYHPTINRRLQGPFPGGGPAPSPGGSTPSPGSGGTPSGDDDTITLTADGGVTNCIFASSGYCSPAAVTSMYTDQSMEERLCSNCVSCGELIMSNQISLPGVMLGSDVSEQEQVDAKMAVWKTSFPCCSCAVIGTGELCAPQVRELSDGNYSSECSSISKLPDFSMGVSSDYEMRPGQVWIESPSCEGEPYKSRDEICVGYFKRDQIETVYEEGSTVCSSAIEYDDTYTTFTSDYETTCKARYITDPNTWLNTEGTSTQYCYPYDEWADNNCMGYGYVEIFGNVMNEMMEYMESLDLAGMTDMNAMQDMQNDMENIMKGIYTNSSSNVFIDGFSNDDNRCPHNGQCYLYPEDECLLAQVGGVFPNYLFLNLPMTPATLKWKPGSTLCTKSDDYDTTTGTGEMMISSVETYATGCDGFEVPFGCEINTDKVAIGDIVVSPEGMFTVCGGDMYDTCRACTLANIFVWDGMSGGHFNYGDAKHESLQVNLEILYGQSIALFFLVMTIIIKEIVGMIILIQQVMVHRGVNTDVDYVTIGKDCGLALIFLVYVLFCHIHSWKDRACYMVRYKELEDGEEEEEEEEEEKEEDDDEKPKTRIQMMYDSISSRLGMMSRTEKLAAADDADNADAGDIELSTMKDAGGDKEEYAVVPTEGADAMDHGEDSSQENGEKEEEKENAAPASSFGVAALNDCLEAWEALTGIECGAMLVACGIEDAAAADEEKEPELVLEPLFEPLEIGGDPFMLVAAWDYLEFIEGIIGIVFGVTFLTGLGSATRSSMIPPEDATALAMISLMSGLADLMTNILGNFWEPEDKWGKRLKMFLQISVMLTGVVLIALIASFPYTQEECLRGAAENAEAA